MEQWDEEDSLLSKYKDKTREMVTFLVAQVEPHGSMTAGWTVTHDADGILVSIKENPGSPFYLTRVEGRVKAHPDYIKEIITTLEYDPLTISLTVLKQMGPNVDISRLCSRSPIALISDRDFALLRFSEKDESTGQWVCGATSVEVDCIPHPQKGYVRGELDKTGWVIQPFGTEGTESFCTYVLGLDPKGWVPSWAVNMFRAKDVFASFLRLREKAEKVAKKKNKKKQKHDDGEEKEKETP